MPERPNILFLMTDQQRGDCLGIEGHPVLQTPNMDALAHAGVRFSRAYSTCPTCIAARRSLLSGQFPPTHGMVGYRDGVEWNAPPTLPQVLGEAGYQTALVGRSMHQHPVRKRYGYDTMELHGATEEYGEWLHENEPHGGGVFGTGVMHNDWTAHPWPLPEHLHTTNWAVDRALRFLERRDPSCPFFLTVSFISPHPPLIPPPFYFERYLRTGVPDPHIGDWEQPPENAGMGLDVSKHSVQLEGERLLAARAGYYGLINHVDDQIRRLLSPVCGIDKLTGRNTIVLLTADHGEMLGDHYRWHKAVPYESSARIPLMLRAPARFDLNAGAVRDEPVGLEDIMPTLLEMAGAEIPDTVEGRSLLPLMRGEHVAWRDHLHLEHAPQHQTLTDGREKFIWWVAEGREQFFDLTEDPNELHDLIGEPAAADRIARWRARLIDELKDRPEGFSDGEKLIPGQRYDAVMPHAVPDDFDSREPFMRPLAR